MRLLRYQPSRIGHLVGSSPYQLNYRDVSQAMDSFATYNGCKFVIKFVRNEFIRILLC
jgi:hypothetical protein